MCFTKGNTTFSHPSELYFTYVKSSAYTLFVICALVCLLVIGAVISFLFGR